MPNFGTIGSNKPRFALSFHKQAPSNHTLKSMSETTRMRVEAQMKWTRNQLLTLEQKAWLDRPIERDYDTAKRVHEALRTR